MNDEIEIEEHDLMENPAIRKIFPDLSMLKKEIEDFGQVEENQNKFADKVENGSDLSPPSPEFQCNMNKVSVNLVDLNKNFSYLNKQDVNVVINNEVMYPPKKLILGSKPKKCLERRYINESSSKNCTVKIVLHDIIKEIKNKYCVICRRLYPTESDYRNHIKIIHPKKIIVGNKKNPSSYTCKVCSVVFSCLSNLNRHCKNIHGKFNKVVKSKSKTIINKRRYVALNKNVISKQELTNKKTNLLKSDKKENACFHCSDVFETQETLIEHLYVVLQSKAMVCKICDRSFTSHQTLNTHMLTHKLNKTSDVERHIKNILKDINPTNDEENVEDCIIKERPKRRLHSETTKKNKRNIKCKDIKIVLNKLKISDDISTKDSTKAANKTIQNLLYRCSVCFLFHINIKQHWRHMSFNHKASKLDKVQKVIFDGECPVCFKIYNERISFNKHMYTFHNDLCSKKVVQKSLNKQNDKCSKQFVEKTLDSITNCAAYCITKEICLKSTIFKCNKCDINFLSVESALDHTGHMEKVINWKCLHCHRIFKKKDKKLHERQHNFCKSFKEYNVTETKRKMFLFNCSKCAVHYHEKAFLKHFYACGLEIPDSFYCKNCDMLLHKDIEVLHKGIHESSASNDFIIIDDDVIQIKRKLSEKVRKLKLKKIISNSNNNDEIMNETNKLSFYYCATCQACVSKYANYVHVKKQCSHMVKYVCKYCGLIFTNKSICGHRRMHAFFKDISLKDFKIYDLHSGERITPPIPDYPSCNLCKIHFPNKKSVKNHFCAEENYTWCEMCQIKLSDECYILHSSFHETYPKYKLQSKNTPIDTLNIDQNKLVRNENENNGLLDNFECSQCRVVFVSYDRVVEHCQMHYQSKAVITMTKKCETCSLNINAECYMYHSRIHDISDVSHATNKFNFSFIILENEIWKNHVFRSIKPERVEEILNNSIYKYECRVKMQKFQEGPPKLTLYKCEKCLCYVGSDKVFAHAEDCNKSKGHPCKVCGLPYISKESLAMHTKAHVDHNLTVNSYRIVIFNRITDQLLNKYLRCSIFLFYQCRNCNEVVDRVQIEDHECFTNNLRKCSCGLLISENDFYVHKMKHEQVERQVNIEVILFGEKRRLKNKGVIVKPTFDGNIYDFTMYKCISCKLCLKTMDNHKCDSNNNVKKCSHCLIYFEAEEFKHHVIIHEEDKDLVDKILRIVPFEPPKELIQNETPNKSGSNVRSNCSSKKNEAPVRVEENTPVVVIEKTVKLYKCKCELNFLDMETANTHKENCHPRNCKQRCSKCNFLFTPKDLFNHLIHHHGTKKYIFKFDIVDV